MKQQISVVTLGTADLSRSREFYVEGFGWKPIFENEEIVFYQMNGFVLGTFATSALAADMNRTDLTTRSAFALGHNVPAREDVPLVIEQLIAAGGRLLRKADSPPHGGVRGYVEDPDGHAWEIAWNPAWAIDDDGHVTFGL
ncbi:VOC family protein [Pararhizobium haloflavum]|uniref:VOC family protein n=1 Tax=Pararhizobium haloflavum TaxID=2037914 RepID=UPI000C19C40B|nr:VOC family protein [Pararhizobium haloflavum]